MGFELLPPLPVSAFTNGANFDAGAYANQLQQQREAQQQDIIAQAQADQERIQQQNAARAGSQALHAAMTVPSAANYANALTLNPTLTTQLKAAHDILDADQQKQALEDQAAIHGNLALANNTAVSPDKQATGLAGAKLAMQRRIDADKAAGRDTTQETQLLAELDQPGGAQAVQAVLGMNLTAVLGKDKADQLLGNATLDETVQHNRAGESVAAATQAETARHNLADENKPVVLADGSVLVDPHGGQAPAASGVPGPPPPPTGAPIDPKTLASIQKNPKTFFSSIAGAPVTITSAARTPAENAAAGGSPTSEHLTGTAWDMVPPPGVTNTQLIAQLRAAAIPFDQIIDEGDHVHFGIGPKMRGQVLQQLPGGHYANIGGAPQQQQAQQGATPAQGGVLFDNRHPEAPGHASTPQEIAAAGLPAGTAAWTGKDGKPVPYAAEFQSNLSQSGVDPKLAGLTGNDLLTALPPAQAQTVRALSEGRLQFPSGMALSKPYWQQMLGLVGQYDPSFDAANPRSRAATRVDFTSGKAAQNITALNTVIGHLDELDHAIDGLHNLGIPAANAAINWAAGATGQDAGLKTFETAKTAVANELTRVFRGTGGAEADIQAWQKQLDAASSPESLRAVVHAMAGLINSRLEALGEQYHQGMGVSKDPISLLTPDKQRMFNRMNSGIAPHEDGTAGTTGSGAWKVVKVH